MDATSYKQKLLDELYAPYQKCRECPLGFLGRNTVVFGEGNPDAQLMFIGEAPGQQEDEQGRPFVGRSGKLLEKTLTQLGLQRSSVFITNIVKCRPPNNRRPTPGESKTCKDLLLIKQIKIIRPTIICTLGSAPLEGLFEKPVQITKVRGKPIEYEGITLIPTFHPAYILRNPAELKTFVHDIKMAIAHIEQK